jgi:hypothetical protein
MVNSEKIKVHIKCLQTFLASFLTTFNRHVCKLQVLYPPDVGFEVDYKEYYLLGCNPRLVG